MKKLVSLLLCVCMLLTVTACADVLTDIAPIGNNRVGWFVPETPWFDFRSSNLNDEEIADLEEAFGFTQYANLDPSFVILTMAVYDAAEQFGASELERIQLMMNIDYANIGGDMLQPQYSALIDHSLLTDKLVGILLIYDEDKEASEPDVALYYFEDDNRMLHFEFEHVYDDEIWDACTRLVSTWTCADPTAKPRTPLNMTTITKKK